jgi:integrase
MKARRSLAAAVEFYLQARGQLGFALKSEHWALPSLVRYARQAGHRGPLTCALALRWAAQSPSQPQRACRLNMVRRFARFCQASDPETELPPPGFFGPGFRRRPVHIYTPEQISALLGATALLGSPRQLRVASLRTVLGLLACTGLRVSEALGLQRQDVDWHRRLLTIRHSKSGHARVIVVQPSTIAALRAYGRLRNQACPGSSTTAFFLSSTGRPLPYSTVRDGFLQLRRHLGWSQRPLPRLHDLRHTFAVRCLLACSRRPPPFDPLILSLSTYLGHRQVTDTYWYFSAIPELMALASRRFETYAAATRP